ncbi:hypothetical protein BGW39_003639, partial [Mortierella sp. 14UC]
MDHPPFDLLLGRAFIEKLRGKTDWEKGEYTFHYHNRRIEIDGVGGTRPRIRREDIGAIHSSPSNLDREEPEDEVDPKSAESDSEYSEEEETENETENEEEERTVQSLIIRAMDAPSTSSLRSISLQELIAEEAQENIASIFLLARVPTVPSWIEEPHCVLSIQAEKGNTERVNDVVFSSNQYGFCLEAPKCRNIMSNTPVRLVPGLEKHNVYVGDLPEVDERMDEIKVMFDKHRGCFPLPGEMSRILDTTKLQAPASFHTDPAVPMPRAYTRKYSPEQIKVLNEYVDTMVRADKMQKSCSPVLCNPLLVAKKDGTFRVCVNFIPVNKMLRPMAWPIPDPMTEIYKLQG